MSDEFFVVRLCVGVGCSSDIFGGMTWTGVAGCFTFDTYCRIHAFDIPGPLLAVDDSQLCH